MTTNHFDELANTLGNASLRRFPAWRAWAPLPAFLALVTAGGCGSASTAVAGKDAATPPADAAMPVADGASPVDTASTADAAGVLGMIVRGPVQPCTEPHSICVNATFPASMTAQPRMLQIDLYINVPPTRPPDSIPLMIESPHLVAGETVQLRMTDMNLTGTYHFLGLVLMPGGGDRMPVTAVDYTGNSSMTYTFTGAPLNLSETLDFQYAP